MGYNPNFRINPEQLELIENALRAEMGRLAKPVPQDWSEENVDKTALREIADLLGHLHNQKRWHKPKKHVPLG
ncbi:MAG: hypothetical protein AAGA76_00890 [Pseudomonadota bacterium]